jgi:hypothetical protein
MGVGIAWELSVIWGLPGADADVFFAFGFGSAG